MQLLGFYDRYLTMINISYRFPSLTEAKTSTFLHPTQTAIAIIAGSFSLALAPVAYAFNPMLVTNQVQVMVPGEATLWLPVADE